MRDRNGDITELGARVVAIGTGDRRYAEAFVQDERIPYLVLVDDDAVAARTASVRTLDWFRLLHPRTWKATRATSKRGFRTHRPGKRVRQIGATFVIGAGDRIRYAYLDTNSTDHADISDVIAALMRPDPIGS